MVKSFNKERIKKNLDIFDWKLTEDENQKIGQIPQVKRVTMDVLVTNKGDWKPHPDDEL